MGLPQIAGHRTRRLRGPPGPGFFTIVNCSSGFRMALADGTDGPTVVILKSARAIMLSERRGWIWRSACNRRSGVAERREPSVTVLFLVAQACRAADGGAGVVDQHDGVIGFDAFASDAFE